MKINQLNPILYYTIKSLKYFLNILHRESIRHSLPKNKELEPSILEFFEAEIQYQPIADFIESLSSSRI